MQTLVVISVCPFCLEPSPPIELTIIDHAITSTGLTGLFKVSPEGQDDITGYILRAVSTDSSVDSKMEIKLQPTGRFVCMKLSAMCELVFDSLHNIVCVLHHMGVRTV